MITVTIAANEIKKNLILMTVSSNNWRWTISISIIFIFGKCYWVESSEVVAKCCRCRKQISEVFRDCFDYFPHKIHKFLSISSIEFHYKEKKSVYGIFDIEFLQLIISCAWKPQRLSMSNFSCKEFIGYMSALIN